MAHLYSSILAAVTCAPLYPSFKKGVDLVVHGISLIKVSAALAGGVCARSGNIHIQKHSKLHSALHSHTHKSSHATMTSKKMSTFGFCPKMLANFQGPISHGFENCCNYDQRSILSTPNPNPENTNPLSSCISCYHFLFLVCTKKKVCAVTLD